MSGLEAMEEEKEGEGVAEEGEEHIIHWGIEVTTEGECTADRDPTWKHITLIKIRFGRRKRHLDALCQLCMISKSPPFSSF